MKKNKKMSHDKRENQQIVAIDLKRVLGRLVAGSFYDHQEVRITEFNRVRDIIRRKLENIPLVGSVEEKKEDKEKFKEEFVDKKIPEYLKKLSDEGKITDQEKFYVERILEVQKNAEKFEKEYEKLMKEFVESELIYTEFLEKIRGISGILSANLIKEFGYCENAQYISSLWKYCGMHVNAPHPLENPCCSKCGNAKTSEKKAEDNKLWYECPVCKEEQYVYLQGKAPVRKRGEKLEFNARLRTMVWKISDSFVKQRTPFYRDIYDKEKKRQVKMMEDWQKKLTKEQEKKLKKIVKRDEKREFVNQFNPKAPVSLMNADLRARRKMIKIFLAHYWQAGKELSQNGEETQKPLAKPYAEDKLGHKHISDWKEAVLKQAKKRADDKIANKRKKTIIC